MTTDTRNLIDLVVNDADVLSLVPAARITAWPSPQDTALPYINYRELSRRPHTRLSGRPASESILIEINAYSRNYGEVKSIIKEIIEAVELNAVVESVGPDIYVDDVDIHRQSITVSYHANR